MLFLCSDNAIVLTPDGGPQKFFQPPINNLFTSDGGHKNKVRNLETSRCRWKTKAIVLKEKVTRLEAQLAEMELKERILNRELNELKTQCRKS